jgi:hypothetical protein
VVQAVATGTSTSSVIGMTNPRAEMLERIRSNIERTGNHVTVVQGGQSPRFAYTVGLTEAGRPEFLLAGANALRLDEVVRALNVAGKSSGGRGRRRVDAGGRRRRRVPGRFHARVMAQGDRARGARLLLA